MATFYIQLENKLLQISGDLTAENISKALGYVPVDSSTMGNYATKDEVSDLVDMSMVEELSQRVNNITFDSLKDNPFLQDGSGELNVTDELGNIIAKIDAEGLHSVDFVAGVHKLTDKADKTYVDEAVKNVTVDLTGYATEEWVENKNYLTEHQDISGKQDTIEDIEEIREGASKGATALQSVPAGYATEEYVQNEVSNIEFYDIKDNPIVNAENGKLIFVDESGNIGLQLDSDNTLVVSDVIAGDHTLSNKANVTDIPSLDGYAKESWVNANLQNYATKDDIKDIASSSTIVDLTEKIETLVGEDSDKSVREIAKIELTEQLLAGNDNFQTLQELAAWIDEHPDSASAMNEAIQKNATDIQSNTTAITNLDTAYKAADTKVLTDAQEYTDNVDFYNIKNNPMVDGEDSTITFVDETGYIGLKVTEDGIIAKDVITPEHTLSEKADRSELPTKVSQLENDSNFLEGESTGLYSDDFSESDGISIITSELYYDDGSGEVVPIKHPDLSTQPSILPYKLAGNYVYEQLLAIPDNITIDNTTGYIKFDIEAPKWEIEKPSILKAVIISSNDGTNAQLNLPCVVVNRGTTLSIAVSDTLFSLVELKNLWMLIEYTSFEGLRGYYYNAENGVEDNKDTSKYNLYINVEDGYFWYVSDKRYYAGIHKLSDEEVESFINNSDIKIYGDFPNTYKYEYMKATLEGFTETRNKDVPWQYSNPCVVAYRYDTYSGVYSLEYNLPLAAEAIKKGEKVILELTDSY